MHGIKPIALLRLTGRLDSFVPLLLKSIVHTKGVITITHTVITTFFGCIFIFYSYIIFYNTERRVFTI